MPPFSLNDVNDVESASKLTSPAKPYNFPYFSVANMKEANSGIYGNAQEILKIEATMIIDFFFLIKKTRFMIWKNMGASGILNS